MEDRGGREYEGFEIPKFEIKVSHEAKLKELLRNIASVELKLFSDATKEFIELLEGDAGGELLREYVRTSSKCSELLQAWKLREGKPGSFYILSLITSILSHPAGKYKPNDSSCISVSRSLDKFAHSIIDENLGELYKELNSKESRRQNAVLLLLASIVRRGSGLASDVAKNFDFKLPIFSKLAQFKHKRFETKRKHSTRKAFVGFAMSFLELGKPGLLRWILQQKEMYSGVLCVLADDDDDENVLYVLSTLCDKVLTPDSLVPPGLRSVLFGSVTLDQLISLSGRENGGFVAEMAYNVLVMVCTDPSNGLMPDLNRNPNPLKGNPTRLLGVMKKLKATEVHYHKDLLMAILNGRPSFGSMYLDEFPYNVEDHTSPTWFAAMSLAAELVSSVGSGLAFGFLTSQPHKPPSMGNPDVQCVIKCIVPRPFTRSVINKGLLHSDSLVKHGTLRFVLEALKLLDSFINAVNMCSSSSSQMMHNWASLKQDIQNEIRIILPDPQVLFSFLSSLNSHCKGLGSSSKRSADGELEHKGNSHKKMKTCVVNEEMDIVVGGIPSSPEIDLLGNTGGVVSTQDVDKLDGEADRAKVISDLWGFHWCSTQSMTMKDEETYFYSKLLEALKIYHQTIPIVFEGAFDFFKILPNNPLDLPTILQQSLLTLLIEHIRWSSKCEIPMKTQPLMYKHLHPFINLLIFSSIKDIKDQAYILAKAAMLSTGAFDKNENEIGAWFLFIPGYNRDHISVGDQGIKMFQNLSSFVISFLCDAVTTTGNSLFKYWDLLRSRIYRLDGTKELSPQFSPLVICVLEKCLRLLSSETGTSTLPEKSMISLYVCNTLRYLLQTQVQAGLLSSLIDVILSERFDERSAELGFPEKLCEWRPLKNLWLFSKGIKNQLTWNISSNGKEFVTSESSFIKTLDETRRFVRSGDDDGFIGVGTAFSFSMLCTRPAEILQSFPSIVSVSSFLRAPFSLLYFIFFNEPRLFDDLLKLWPEMSIGGLQEGMDLINGKGIKDKVFGVIDSMEPSVAFSFFLMQAPFPVLFPVILNADCTYLLGDQKLQSVLLEKLNEGTTDNMISSFHQTLFWIDQIHSSYRSKPSEDLEKRSELCFRILNHMLKQLLVAKLDSTDSSYVLAPSSTQIVQEVAETILCHPAVIVSLECPLYSREGLTDAVFGEPLENFLHLARNGVHKMNFQVMNLLKTISEQLSSSNKRIVKAFKSLVQRLFLIFRDRFDQCMNMKDLVPLIPILCALHMIIPFISPFELLEFVHWLLSRINYDDSIVGVPSKLAALSVGLCIASRAFDLLTAYLQEPGMKQSQFALFWRVDSDSCDVALFEKIYFRVFEIATRFKLDAADLCLLKAVNVVNKYTVKRNSGLPLTMNISRVIANTPMSMLSHCIHRTNKIKARLLFLLTEVSPLHLSFFGHSFSDMMNKYLLLKGKVKHETRDQSLSDEDFMLLMPTVLSYLNSTSVKFGLHFYKHFGNVTSFYWKILLRFFSNRKSSLSWDMFEVEFDELLPLSVEEEQNFFNSSLLGKAILMLRHYFALSTKCLKLKKRLKLFNSICPNSEAHNDLLECDVSQFDQLSVQQALNTVNKAVAKISLCRMLLFTEDNQVQFPPKEGEEYVKEEPSEVESNEENLSRLQFLNVLVLTWQVIVKEKSSLEGNGCSLFRFLEVLILRNIMEMTAKMQNYLINLDSLPFIEQLARSSLLHRFEDPTTLEMLRNIFTSLSKGKFSCISVLQLLLAHSQFAPTFHSGSEVSGSSQLGMVFRPMSSILGFCTPRNILDRKDIVQASDQYKKQLEVVKLLRLLFRIKAKTNDSDTVEDIGINSGEVLSLLLSSYGATPSEIDREMYNLMHEIESADESRSGSIADIDYLWGNAAIKVRKERELDHGVLSGNIETIEEHRRIQFRENLPIDPMQCARTVLDFPFDRTAGACFVNTGKMYDPIFIMRLSIHSLTMGYVEPVEFASLGLLAVAFVSISSTNDDLRKLGYEALERFKSALEKCQKRKDVMRLRLLLTYLQNGIEEPWQRIPSVTAVFVAEASVVLLDPAHNHYSTISKHLMRSPSVNMKGIPLFQNFFRSSSVNFKAERLWIIRLLYAGLNLEDDAQIYIRNSVFDTLLSFFASPLSDDDSKELILLMVKKSVKLHKMARFLVENCGLIPWLSSVVSFFYQAQYREQKYFPLIWLSLALKVITDINTSRTTTEWLAKHALEQLSELSSHLYKLLVDGIELIKEDVELVNSILQVLTSTLKISQKRKIYQPHFTLSIEALFKLCQTVDICCNGVYSSTSEFGLKTVLMSTPPAGIFSMDREKLVKFIQWAISTALHSDCKKTFQPPEESNRHRKIFIDEEQSEESLAPKLLRWLTASVILGKLSLKFNQAEINGFVARADMETLKSLLEYNKKIRLKKEAEFGCEEIVADAILYIHRFLGVNFRSVRSVVSALCLLLCSGPFLEGMENENCLNSMCSKIRCPDEANPSWRWSYYQPWKDLESEAATDSEKIDEIHACQMLLILISNLLGKYSNYLNPQDFQNFGVFKWERSILESE